MHCLLSLFLPPRNADLHGRYILAVTLTGIENCLLGVYVTKEALRPTLHALECMALTRRLCNWGSEASMTCGRPLDMNQAYLGSSVLA
jgi:hypothetical protein